MISDLDTLQQIDQMRQRLSRLEVLDRPRIVFVTQFAVYDDGAVQWANVQKNTGAYRFNMTDANNALPSGIRAVLLRLYMKWPSAGDTVYCYTREYGGTDAQLAAWSTVASIRSPANGLQTVDATNYAFEIVVSGANNTLGSVYCMGYLI